MSVDIEQSFGKMMNPFTGFIHFIGGSYYHVYDAKTKTVMAATIFPLAQQMQDESANSFPVIRTSKSTGIFIPYFNKEFSKQLYQISLQPEDTKIISNAPACDFFNYARFGPGRILAFDHISKAYQLYEDGFFQPFDNVFPGHPSITMASFTQYLVIFSEESDDVCLLDAKDQKSRKIIKVNRPNCKKWFVDAVYLNLVFMSCESEAAVGYAVFDILQQKVIGQTDQSIDQLHFPYISENGLLLKNGENFDIQDILNELFKIKYEDILEECKMQLSKHDNSLAEFERDIYKQFGLIDSFYEIKANFGNDIYKEIESYKSAMVQTVSELKGQMETRLSKIEMEIELLKKK